MIVLILVELALIALASLGFVLVLNDPRKATDPVIAWHLWCFAVLAAVEACSLFALGLGIRVPAFVFALGYGGQALVAAWRLVLAVQGRRRR